VTRLFELTKLRIHVDHHTDRGVIEITLPATGAHDVAAVAAELPTPQQHAKEQPMMQNKQVKAGVNAACAAPGALSDPLLPVDCSMSPRGPAAPSPPRPGPLAPPADHARRVA